MNDFSSPTAPSRLDDILELTRADRRAVDRLIIDRLASDVVLVNQISRHIISGGGKRMRPLVHLLCARAAGYDGRDHLKLAAIIEFIHTSTLLHDDVVDESSRRRGQVTAHRLWGNAASVLVGDFLYSRSFQLMVELDRMRIMNILADTTNTIAEGEVLQLMHMGNPDLGVEDYYQVISDKTACLFAASARLGGVLGEMDDDACERLAEYGLYLGQAFQIVDDVLDYRADGDDLGKNTGDDLAEGKVTLPLILALEAADSDERALIREIIEAGGSDRITDVRRTMERTGALDLAMSQARELSRKATLALSVLPESEERSALEFLAGYAVNRAY
ncbi:MULTISPECIES: polyprenyl synthetase family protein [unclassified Wenzhouxiangella]|uniref:polyprenyl synthetase family protein n=1 Tax=unclassified Wenzhouxiangella TaxID=2613841 RepID=UPI000E3292DB|nr:MULTISPECIES: polyprenyl synthetase family protein [unclassified Wenzhouxiangella]RFF27840.1 octaprenyl-diphosphate synthase [Wenzhouxiangella sp. 15181]RFP70315.1 octaprenyl-diphosphate synthase [Wenzhouxiangella sp. 15190]